LREIKCPATVYRPEMARFMSASQIKALGDRLARSIEASSDDRELLRRLIADYVRPMEVVQDRIRVELAVPSTGRPKTEKTTIEKLRRDRTRLNKMQDLAGVRIVTVGMRAQDELVERLQVVFPDVRVIDLRDREDNPYRAVHVIADVDDCPVEIQVRTRLQHAWADVFERLADATDRRIRYGAIPRDPQARRLHDMLLELAPLFRGGEKEHKRLEDLLAEGNELHAEMIRMGPFPKDHPRATERNLVLRRLTRRRRRWRQEIEKVDPIIEGLNEIAREIREGQRTFERGIVE
jgi:ppGpp synthetase/RelA/SpoT-type nucleotidyltranferase